MRSAPERRTGDLSGFANQNTVPTPGSVSSGAYRYNTDDAFRVASVVACVGLRAGAFAQIPLKGYEDAAGVSTLLAQQPEILTSPSSVPVVVPSIWKTQMSISRDVWGYAAGQIRGVDAAGYVSKVDWVCPDIIHARQEYVGGPLIWKFGSTEIDASMVYHIPSRWVSPGNPLGMSPLEKSGLVDLAKRAQDFGRDWFRNGAVPSSIVYSDKELTEVQADSLFETIRRRWTRRQPAVLGAGMKFESVSVAANESQFLETMRQAASDVAISFNLPPEMIAAAVASGSITYANREQNIQQYLIQSINPDFVVIQEVMGLHMRPGTYPRWMTGAFLRADLKTRYESYKVAGDIGLLTIDEMRGLEDMPPLSAEDKKQSRSWQAVGLPTLVEAGLMTPNEARAQLGLGPVAGGEVPTFAKPGPAAIIPQEVQSE